MQERASVALSQIRLELQKAGACARLQLMVQSGSGAPRVQVTLQCDNYSDVMATSAQVKHRHNPIPSTLRALTCLPVRHLLGSRPSHNHDLL